MDKDNWVSTLFAIGFIIVSVAIHLWVWHCYYQPLGIPWWAVR